MLNPWQIEITVLKAPNDPLVPAYRNAPALYRTCLRCTAPYLRCTAPTVPTCVGDLPLVVEPQVAIGKRAVGRREERIDEAGCTGCRFQGLG